MQNEHARLIRGLNIATVALSALALAGCLLGLAGMGLGQAILDEYGPSAIQYSQSHLDHGMAAHLHDDYYGSDLDLDENDLMGFANLAMAIGFAAVGWEAAVAVVALVAGIMGLRGASRRDRLSSVFGWGIAGAAAAFLGGRIITCVLFVISAIYASKDKNAPCGLYDGYAAGEPAFAYRAGSGAAPAVPPYASAYPTAGVCHQPGVGVPAGAVGVPAGAPGVGTQPATSVSPAGVPGVGTQPVAPAPAYAATYMQQPTAGAASPTQTVWPAPVAQPAGFQPTAVQCFETEAQQPQPAAEGTQAEATVQVAASTEQPAAADSTAAAAATAEPPQEELPAGSAAPIEASAEPASVPIAQSATAESDPEQPQE